MKITRCITLSLMVWLCSAGEPADLKRLHFDINDGETFRLSGNTRPAVARGVAVDQGTVPGWQQMPRMSLHFAMTEAQRADLDQLLKAQQNRRSPQYRKFLTPEQYAERFGIGGVDLAPVVRWLENSGFRNVQVARSRTSVSFAGTAAQAQSAFRTPVHQYQLSGESHLANVSDPELPKALSGLVESVGGLHNFQLKPHARLMPHYTNPYATGFHSLAPDDWTTIYNIKPLYATGLDGTGVSIVVVGQSNVQLSDLQAFRSAAGLPAKDPTVVVPPTSTNPGTVTDDEMESDLDLEWAGAMAPNADIIFVTANATTGNGVYDALKYAIDNNIASILSMSYGRCEPDVSAADFTTMNSLLAQASAQGMTILAGSGDGGATGCDAGNDLASRGLAVDFIASSPYVTGVGGTEFNDADTNYWSATNNGKNGSALSYIPESAWSTPGHIVATGGGASTVFPKPSWQVGPGVPADGQRDVPDIAFAANPTHDPYLFCGHNWCVNGFANAGGQVEGAGGTSLAAPAFAGVLALLVQKTGGRLGNINTNLYSLVQVSANAFHDIVTGDNTQKCSGGSTGCPQETFLGYFAGPGYDQTTGVGSIDGYHFVEQWSGDIELTASPATLTINPGSSATSTISVAPQNHFSGDVSLTCSVSSSLIDVTCSLPATPIHTSGTATLTITAASSARTPMLPRMPQMPKSQYEWLLFGAALGLGVWILRRRSAHLVGLGVVAAAELVLIGCGSGSSSGGGTTPQSLTLTCSLPSNAKEGVAYSASCSAANGTPAYTYSVVNGILPSGLSMSATTGAITGTPVTPGVTSFSIQVTDSAVPANSATQKIQAFVVMPATALTLTCPLPDAQAGIAYTSGCQPNGGTPPVSYSINDGSLPAGLTLVATATSPWMQIQGIPTVVGTSSFTVRATDSGLPPVSTTVATHILVQPAPALNLSCNLLNAQAHVPYAGSCSVTGGAPPMTFSILTGALPMGIIMDSSGLLSGTPSFAGTSQFTVSVTDTGYPRQTKAQAATLTVDPPPTETGTVTVTATSGGIVNTTTIVVTVPGRLSI